MILSRNSNEKFICKSCKKIFIAKRGSFGYHCSNKCQKHTEFLIKYYKWLHNNQEPWSFKSPREYKKAVIYRDKYECYKCKISDWNKKLIVLELEHKDGNSENNKSENLCLICPNCHSQTDTYKSKNKGKGRHYRKQRYAEGKSY